MSGWIDVERARTLPGLRLVLTAGVPGPWGEAAKGLFHVKKIPAARVRQQGGGANDALFAWTGQRNAPVAVWEDEAPVTGSAELIHLAERLAPEPALVPEHPAERALMFGLVHELAGENGLGWCRRLMMFQRLLGDAEEPPEALRPVLSRMLRQYRYGRAAAAAAGARAAGILSLLSEQLAAQHAAGSRFLVGEALSAADVYWAAFAALFDPFPDELCPMPEPMRRQYAAHGLGEALDPALLAHRDFVYRGTLELPIAL